MPAPDVGCPRAAVRVAAGLLLAATAAAGGACAGPERTDAPVREEVYVEVMARLAAITAAADSGRLADPLSRARADSLRAEVMRAHGVTRSDLERYARLVGDEPGRMKALWERIGDAADSLSEAGWPLDTAAAAGDSLTRDTLAGDTPGDEALPDASSSDDTMPDEPPSENSPTRNREES